MARVRYNQPGYVGCSMSERAAEAYRNGERPKSRWTKRDMLTAIEQECKCLRLVYNGELSTLTKAEIFNGYFEWSGWHHTGKYARETDFYEVSDDALIAAFPDIDLIKEEACTRN